MCSTGASCDVLILLALIACAVLGRDRVHHLCGQDARRAARRRRTHPAVMRDWWIVGTAAMAALTIASFFLLLGGLDRRRNGRRGRVASRHDHDAAHMGAAAGARAPCPHGRVRDPRRAHRARVADRVPRGAGSGRARERIDRRRRRAVVDALVAAMLRTSLLTAIGAMLGVALATLGRNTAFALVVVFGWITVVEGMIRGFKPGLARFLWGENMTTVLSWAQIEQRPVRARSRARASLDRVLRVGVRRGRDVAFSRRDVGGAS